MINAILNDILTTTKTIKLKNNLALQYDKLILAPDIDFKYVNNYDINKIPHAWRSGEQINILKNKI